MRDRSPVAGGGLERYASGLGAVTINSTFYRRPSISTFERWVADPPADFRIAVKALRELTHRRKRDAKTGSRALPPISGVWATACDRS